MRTSRRSAPARPQGALWAVGADPAGEVFDLIGWVGAGRSGNDIRLPREDELTEVPSGAPLQFLEGRAPLAWQRKARGEAQLVDGAWAVAVQLPSGYCRTLLPAYRRQGGVPYLPFFGYTAVFARGEKLYCAAVRTDKNPAWQPRHYGGPDLEPAIAQRLEKDPGNRVLEQLKICAIDYGCYNAQNIFLSRWEGAVPVSPACNAQCVGCISLQPDGLPPSPQTRFRFVPSLEEVVSVGLAHLRDDSSIYSFGQGCEGEPLLQADLIARSVRALREQTPLGTIHLNTNASKPEGFRKVVEAGLDSVRISLNSVLAEHYEPYYQPRGYSFADVLDCIRVARDHGLLIHLNYLHMPGWNDREQEVEALIALVQEMGVHMIQMRNLNIDPDLYAGQVSMPGGSALGVPTLLARLRHHCPKLRIGNHTLPRQVLRRG